MPTLLDPKQMNLLSQLCEVLQSLSMPSLLQHLSSPPHTCSLIPLKPLTQLEPTLLQKMNETRSFTDSSQLSTPLETVTLLK
jgi:hypothetical protein